MVAARDTLLTLLAAGSAAAGSWVDVGERNYAAVEKYVKIVHNMDGRTLTPTKFGELATQVESLFARKVACRWFPESRYQVDLKDVGADACFAAMGANFDGWLRQTRSVASATGIDPKSGGKVILVEWDDVAEGVTPSGDVVPGTRTHFPTDTSVFEFDDEGRIVRFDGSSDSGLLDGIRDKVEAYTMRTDLSERATAPFSAAACGAMACVWVAGLALGGWVARRGSSKGVEQPKILG